MLGVIQYIPPEIAVLYTLLEVEFDPLKLCVRVKHSLDSIETFATAKDPKLMQYVESLQAVSIVRLLKQLSQVYDTISISRICELIPFSTPQQVELVLIDASRNFDLQARVDHRSGSVSFGQDLSGSHRMEFPADDSPVYQAMPSDIIRDQLCNMPDFLTKAVLKINPTSQIQALEELRHQLLHVYKKSARPEHTQILQRRQIIEERKELIESENTRREREEQEAVDEQRRKVYEAEQARLTQEAKERDRQRQERERAEIQKQLNRERLEKLKTTVIGSKIVKEIMEDESVLAVLDPDTILAKQVEQLEREKKELQAKLKAQEKKVDHFVRACHLEEIPLLEKEYDEYSKADREWWGEQERERVAQLKQERKSALEHQKRLARMSQDKNDFIKTLKEERKTIYKQKLKEFDDEIKDERVKRLGARKAQRKEEEKQKAEEEYEERMRKLEEMEEKKREREREEAAQEEYEEKKETTDKAPVDTWRVEKDEEKPDEKKVWRPGQSGASWREREKERIERWRRPSETEDTGRNSEERAIR